ncbi:ribosome recycling factor family protein [Vibrio intestinalis]|uniref:ribosome recycling factor family protein n=1 Tax=Vibrio intestinalis TaxID=2933291 RepID=UPI0021A8B7F9|nr:ribosome recycling factor family protein [Vibrio intestinalis]
MKETISLPSLIHRIGREQLDVARDLATQYQCQLKRVRRSRHWQLIGEISHISDFCTQLSQLSQSRFIQDKVERHLNSLKPSLSIEQQLAALIEANPAITLSELMSETNCTQAEARRARFDADAF